MELSSCQSFIQNARLCFAPIDRSVASLGRVLHETQKSGRASQLVRGNSSESSRFFSMTEQPSDHRELWREAFKVVRDSGLGVLTTADDSGKPHATWMGSVGAPQDLSEIFTITGPSTDKIANVRKNPNAEWMFASPAKESIVYLSGKIEIVDAESDRWSYWNKVPNKSQAFFLRYYDEAGGFAVLRMGVERVVFCKPMAFRKIVLKDG
ncbi:MAG: general stress protein 26 [Verrucomicrobiales bacterium]